MNLDGIDAFHIAQKSRTKWISPANIGKDSLAHAFPSHDPTRDHEVASFAHNSDVARSMPHENPRHDVIDLCDLDDNFYLDCISADHWEQLMACPEQRVKLKYVPALLLNKVKPLQEYITELENFLEGTGGKKLHGESLAHELSRSTYSLCRHGLPHS